MKNAYLNYIATAVPKYDINQKFIDYAISCVDDTRSKILLKVLANRSEIKHRYSIFKPSAQANILDEDNFYNRSTFPSTKERMVLYEQNAFSLACKALDALDLSKFKNDITHIIITTCTGFYSPSIDLQIIKHYNLKPSVERVIVGFMGCCAAINALKLARHIVNSSESAKVLIVNIELCSLHLQNSSSVEDLLPFLIFADGCAVSIVSAEKIGIELQSFYSTILPNSSDKITWHIGNSGFDMVLSSLVSKLIVEKLPQMMNEILAGKSIADFSHFAIHPGGRSIIEAVAKAMNLSADSLLPSRKVLSEFGNMSSAAIMFVLKEMMQQKNSKGQGFAIAFGPGVVAETMLFCML